MSKTVPVKTMNNKFTTFNSTIGFREGIWNSVNLQPEIKEIVGTFLRIHELISFNGKFGFITSIFKMENRNGIFVDVTIAICAGSNQLILTETEEINVEISPEITVLQRSDFICNKRRFQNNAKIVDVDYIPPDPVAWPSFPVPMQDIIVVPYIFLPDGTGIRNTTSEKCYIQNISPRNIPFDMQAQLINMCLLAPFNGKLDLGGDLEETHPMAGSIRCGGSCKTPCRKCIIKKSDFFETKFPPPTRLNESMEAEIRKQYMVESTNGQKTQLAKFGLSETISPFLYTIPTITRKRILNCRLHVMELGMVIYMLIWTIFCLIDTEKKKLKLYFEKTVSYSAMCSCKKLFKFDPSKSDSVPKIIGPEVRELLDSFIVILPSVIQPRNLNDAALEHFEGIISLLRRLWDLCSASFMEIFLQVTYNSSRKCNVRSCV
jgi:hypothetical protein